MRSPSRIATGQRSRIRINMRRISFAKRSASQPRREVGCYMRDASAPDRGRSNLFSSRAVAARHLITREQQHE